MLRGHCSVTYNSQKVGTTKRPSTDEQISQVWYINITEYHSALKRKAVWTLSSLWVNLEDIMLSEISQTPRDKYCMISLILGS